MHWAYFQPGNPTYQNRLCGPAFALYVTNRHQHTCCPPPPPPPPPINTLPVTLPPPLPRPTGGSHSPPSGSPRRLSKHQAVVFCFSIFSLGVCFQLMWKEAVRSGSAVAGKGFLLPSDPENLRVRAEARDGPQREERARLDE